MYGSIQLFLEAGKHSVLIIESNKCCLSSLAVIATFEALLDMSVSPHYIVSNFSENLSVRFLLLPRHISKLLPYLWLSFSLP